METTEKNKNSGIIKGCLFAILISLIIFAFGQSYTIIKTYEESYTTLSSAFAQQNWLTHNYFDLYHQTEVSLVNTTQELDTTKGMLTQTETLLNQAKAENTNLQDQVLALKNAQQIGDQVNQLNEASVKANQELGALQTQLKAVDGSFDSVEEGRKRLVLLQEKIQSIKNRIRDIKHDAFLARKAAQDEVDRIALLNGNQGFLVKDGQDFKPQDVKAQENPNVNINVSFYEK